MSEVIIDTIGVTAPYYALDNVSLSDDEVTADFAAEQPMESEAGCIAAAEVGRHLAVLGACALAKSNPVKKKHYYIALSAELRNVNNNAIIQSRTFSGVARTLNIDKRNGLVFSELYAPDRTLLYTLNTSYSIMSEQLFQRMFNEKRQDYDYSLAGNPYALQFPLSNIEFIDHTIHARFGPFKPEECSGHFASFPCIPVAILMHGLSRTAGRLMAQLTGGDTTRYKVVSADVKADAFAFAGENINMTAKFKGRDDAGDYIFNCRAERSDGTTYGSMLLTLALVDRADACR